MNDTRRNDGPGPGGTEDLKKVAAVLHLRHWLFGRSAGRSELLYQFCTPLNSRRSVARWPTTSRAPVDGNSALQQG